VATENITEDHEGKLSS